MTEYALIGVKRGKRYNTATLVVEDTKGKQREIRLDGTDPSWEETVTEINMQVKEHQTEHYCDIVGDWYSGTYNSWFGTSQRTLNETQRNLLAKPVRNVIRRQTCARDTAEYHGRGYQEQPLEEMDAQLGYAQRGNRRSYEVLGMVGVIRGEYTRIHLNTEHPLVKEHIDEQRAIIAEQDRETRRANAERAQIRQEVIRAVNSVMKRHTPCSYVVEAVSLTRVFIKLPLTFYQIRDLRVSGTYVKIEIYGAEEKFVNVQVENGGVMRKGEYKTLRERLQLAESIEDALLDYYQRRKDRPFINTDTRYGDPELVNLEDYKELNPLGAFEVRDDGIYEYEHASLTYVRIAVKAEDYKE